MGIEEYAMTTADDPSQTLSPVARPPADVGQTLASRGFVTTKLDDLVNWARPVPCGR